MAVLEVIQSVGAQRYGLALVAVALWVCVCLQAWCKHGKPAGSNQAAVLVAFASQTGAAEALARATALQVQELTGNPRGVKLLPLGSVTHKDLQNARRLLLIVSTTGQGAAPENARQFEQRFLQRAADLGKLEYALLGLGDRRYKHFCGFADRLDQWLNAQGANRLNETLKSDRNDPRTLAQWQQNLERITDTTQHPETA